MSDAMNVRKKVQGADGRCEGGFTSAIILAGGMSTRFGNVVPKQHSLIGGIPIVVRSLVSFQNCSDIDEIVVVCKENDRDLYIGYKEQYAINKISSIVTGGETRQDSVGCGLSAVSEKCRFIAIHDAARCLISSECISKVINEAYCSMAAIAGYKAIDSVIIEDGLGYASGEQIDRGLIWHAQTPQVFYKDLYEKCIDKAKKDNFVGTDDSSVVIRAGYKVKLVQCSKNNMKITYQDDIEIAETILLNSKKDN